MNAKSELAKRVARYFEPMISKVQHKFCQQYQKILSDAGKLDKVDGFDVFIDVRVHVYPNESVKTDTVSVCYDHKFAVREFLSDEYREKLKKGESSEQLTKRRADDR